MYAEIFGKGGNEDALSTAFSGQTLLAGVSGGIVYFLSFDVLTKDSVAAITIVNSVAGTVMCTSIFYHYYIIIVCSLLFY